MLQIEQASFRDLTSICNLIEQLQQRTKLPNYFTFDREYTWNNLKDLYEKPILDRLFLVSKENNEVNGFILGIKGSCLYTPEPLGLELYWYVDHTNPITRTKISLRLLHLYEDWCKQVGIKTVSIGQTDQFTTDLTKLGYDLIEKTYYKEIK